MNKTEVRPVAIPSKPPGEKAKSVEPIKQPNEPAKKAAEPPKKPEFKPGEREIG